MFIAKAEISKQQVTTHLLRLQNWSPRLMSKMELKESLTTNVHLLYTTVTLSYSEQDILILRVYQLVDLKNISFMIFIDNA